MKIRYGFVSNSSSSSFTCDICKETVELYNGEGGEDGEDYLTCDNCHSVCSKHVKVKSSVESLRNSVIKAAKESCSGEELEKELVEIGGMNREELEEYIMDVYGCDMPSECCPLCQFTTLTDDDLMEYLLMLVGSTKKSMIEGAIKTYPSYNAFCKAIKEHKKTMKEQRKK
jgi:hypothetical protein